MEIIATLLLIYGLLFPIVYVYECRKQLEENYKENLINTTIFRTRKQDVRLTTEQKQANFLFALFFPFFYLLALIFWVLRF